MSRWNLDAWPRLTWMLFANALSPQSRRRRRTTQSDCRSGSLSWSASSGPTDALRRARRWNMSRCRVLSEAAAADLLDAAESVVRASTEVVRAIREGLGQAKVGARPETEQPKRQASQIGIAQSSAVNEPTQATSQSPADAKLGKGEMKVLAVLAQWPDGRSYNELAFLAGYSAKASTLGVILSKLRKIGYVRDGQPIRLTAAGLEAAGGAQPLPSGPELLDHWRRHPRMGAGERRVLDVLIEHYPNELTHEQLCEAAGYSPAASTIGVILSKLRKLGLVDTGARRAAAEFMESIAS
jgi:hypothetical protein